MELCKCYGNIYVVVGYIYGVEFKGELKEFGLLVVVDVID